MNAAGRSGPSATGSEGAQRSGTGLEAATGRDRDAWFGVLDEWGAAGRPFREIADWLTGEHGMSAWWAQKVIVEYEQARGLRPPGIRPDGTFSVTASKTVGVPIERLFKAFVDAELRERWLPGVAMRERTRQPGRSARFDWEDGSTRLGVDFLAVNDQRSQAAVEHQRLPDAGAAETKKAYWQERLAVLKDLLEG